MWLHYQSNLDFIKEFCKKHFLKNILVTFFCQVGGGANIFDMYPTQAGGEWGTC